MPPRREQPLSARSLRIRLLLQRRLEQKLNALRQVITPATAASVLRAGRARAPPIRLQRRWARRASCRVLWTGTCQSASPRSAAKNPAAGRSCSHCTRRAGRAVRPKGLGRRSPPRCSRCPHSAQSTNSSTLRWTSSTNWIGGWNGDSIVTDTSERSTRTAPSMLATKRSHKAVRRARPCGSRSRRRRRRRRRYLCCSAGLRGAARETCSVRR